MKQVTKPFQLGLVQLEPFDLSPHEAISIELTNQSSPSLKRKCGTTISHSQVFDETDTQNIIIMMDYTS